MTTLLPQEAIPVTVDELQKLRFSQLSLSEKVAIKARGRPLPDIQTSQPGIGNNKDITFVDICVQLVFNKMAGAVIETLSTRKLCSMVLGLILLEIGFILLGGLVAPRPTHPLLVTATNCISNGNQNWMLPHHCKQESLEPASSKTNPNDIVFSVLVPHLTKFSMTRWFQYMLSLAHFSIPFHPEQQIGDNPVVTMDIRLAYSNNPDAWKIPEAWKPLTKALVERPLVCDFPHEKIDKNEGYNYDCDHIFLMQLGSVAHKYYLFNIRLPVDETEQSPNRNIGKILTLETVHIFQTGGFTKIWCSMKIALFVIMLFPLVWYWRRVVALARASLLIEKAIFILGLSMVFLNAPLELVTIFTEAQWMLLFTDLRQGLFYAVLFSFWVIFTGEHLMDQAHRNNLSAYRFQLSSIIISCLAFLGFELSERGMQLSNPSYTIWTRPNLAFGLLICGCIAGVLYFLLLCYLVFRVFRSIGFKRRFILVPDRSKHFNSIVNRFKVLMALTIGTAGLSVAFFILQQKLQGLMDHYLPEDYEFNASGGFFTGVYGLWNIYVFLVLSLYAPSHKHYISTDYDEGSEQETVAINDGNGGHMELMSLTQEKLTED